MSVAAVLLAACAIDAVVGWPGAIHKRIGHPVTWMGALTSLLDRRLNTGSRAAQLAGGTLAVGLVVGLSASAVAAVQSLLPDGGAGLLLSAVLAWPFLALRSLDDHVAAVAVPLAAGDLEAARRSVAMIVGRDPARLDEAGVARAALESLAENTSDGIVAPVFWALVAGLPGLAAYKAVNTLDSMIGHRDARYEAFGKPAARLDDVANLIPARLTALLFAAVSGRPVAALRVAWRDAHRHRSPNAGWPEAAMAAALDVRLSGPRAYGDSVADEPWLNGAAPDPEAAELGRGLALYRRAMLLMGGALALLALY